MIWVAWRQQRLQILVTLGLILIAAAVVVSVRLDAQAMLAGYGLANCWTIADGCVSAHLNDLSQAYSGYLSLYPLVGLAMPVVLGLFAGAPMFAREAERGTHIFGLTQGVGRTRWWLTKALVGGLPVVLAMTALGLLNTWSLAPLRPIMGNRFMTPFFESEGVVLGGYTLLAVATGIMAGLWLRNTVSAMAVTLALYLGVIVALTNGVRAEWYQPPVDAIGSVDVRDSDSLSQRSPDAWLLRSGFVNTAGERVRAPADCFVLDGGADPRDYEELVDANRMLDERVQCLADLGLVNQFAVFHPMTRFWPFQFIETAVVLLLSLGLLGLAAVAVRRRLT